MLCFYAIPGFYGWFVRCFFMVLWVGAHQQVWVEHSLCLLNLFFTATFSCLPLVILAGGEGCREKVPQMLPATAACSLALRSWRKKRKTLHHLLPLPLLLVIAGGCERKDKVTLPPSFSEQCHCLFPLNCSGTNNLLSFFPPIIVSRELFPLPFLYLLQDFCVNPSILRKYLGFFCKTGSFSSFAVESPCT